MLGVRCRIGKGKLGNREMKEGRLRGSALNRRYREHEDINNMVLRPCHLLGLSLLRLCMAA